MSRDKITIEDFRKFAKALEQRPRPKSFQLFDGKYMYTFGGEINNPSKNQIKKLH